MAYDEQDIADDTTGKMWMTGTGSKEAFVPMASMPSKNRGVGRIINEDQAAHPGQVADENGMFANDVPVRQVASRTFVRQNRNGAMESMAVPTADEPSNPLAAQFGASIGDGLAGAMYSMLSGFANKRKYGSFGAGAAAGAAEWIQRNQEQRAKMEQLESTRKTKTADIMNFEYLQGLGGAGTPAGENFLALSNPMGINPISLLNLEQRKEEFNLRKEKDARDAGVKASERRQEYEQRIGNLKALRDSVNQYATISKSTGATTPLGADVRRGAHYLTGAFPEFEKLQNIQSTANPLLMGFTGGTPRDFAAKESEILMKLLGTTGLPPEQVDALAKQSLDAIDKRIAWTEQNEGWKAGRGTQPQTATSPTASTSGNPLAGITKSQLAAMSKADRDALRAQYLQWQATQGQ